MTNIHFLSSVNTGDIITVDYHKRQTVWIKEILPDGCIKIIFESDRSRAYTYGPMRTVEIVAYAHRG